MKKEKEKNRKKKEKKQRIGKRLREMKERRKENHTATLLIDIPGQWYHF